MNCPYCYSTIGENAKFCPNCGANLLQEMRNIDSREPVMRNYKQVPGSPQQSCPGNDTINQPNRQYYTVPASNGKEQKTKKSGSCLMKVLAVFGALCLLGIVGSLFSGSGGKEDIAVEQETASGTKQREEQNENTETSKEEEDKQDSEQKEDESWRGPEKIDYSIPVSEMESGGYAYVTTEDLDRYVVNMTGQKIYTVVQIDKIDEERIQADISEDFMFQTFETIYDYTPYFKEGDTVGIFGTVGNTEGMFGADWTNILNCQVFAYGKEAEAYIKDKTDDSLAEFLTLTEAVANSAGKDNISEEEFKSLCQYYSYEDILRNPDSYKKRYAVVSGTADQTVEGLFGLYTTIYITDGNGNKWGCNIIYEEGQSRILEGDYITVYGILDGTTTTTTVLGKQVTMPFITIEYVE